MYRWPNATGFDRRFVVCQSRDGLKCVARFLLHGQRPVMLPRYIEQDDVAYGFLDTKDDCRAVGCPGYAFRSFDGHWKIGQLLERFARLRLGYPHGGEAVPGNRNGGDLVWL